MMLFFVLVCAPFCCSRAGRAAIAYIAGRPAHMMNQPGAISHSAHRLNKAVCARRIQKEEYAERKATLLSGG